MQTRACYVTENENKIPSLVLVPWADFLNHSVHVDTDALFDPGDKSYLVLLFVFANWNI